MSQRRMPSGQGPARGGARPSASAGARRGRRGGAGRTIERSPDPRSSVRWSRTQPADRTDRTDGTQHRAGPRTGVRRAVGPARRIKAPQRPRRLSGRAAALGLLLLALTLAYAYPLRVYLAQQAEIDQMAAAQQVQRQKIQELSDRVAAWNDDEYVIAQARSRLQLVRAGERIYVVGVEPAPAGAATQRLNQPWYRKLWSSVETADDPPAAP